VGPVGRPAASSGTSMPRCALVLRAPGTCFLLLLCSLLLRTSALCSVGLALCSAGCCRPACHLPLTRCAIRGIRGRGIGRRSPPGSMGELGWAGCGPGAAALPLGCSVWWRAAPSGPPAAPPLFSGCWPQLGPRVPGSPGRANGDIKAHPGQGGY
jgi:hypothetical protein